MPSAKPRPWSDDPASVRPMLATGTGGLADDLLDRPRWVFERKLDGMRVLALIEPSALKSGVRLWTRNGREKSDQFPDLVKDLRRFARTLRRTVLLDGELVALDAGGRPQSFQRLAKRIHLTGRRTVLEEADRTPVAFVVFDVLRDGTDDLRPLPLVQRRARLEKIINNAGSEQLRLGDQSAGGEGRRWLASAQREHWEGLIAKDAESAYASGKRSPAWRKLKLPCRQEFVVGGWTRPRGSRQRFGSLLVGYYEGRGADRRLHYAGSVGSGYDGAELDRLWPLLQARRTERSPFATRPAPPEPPSWVRPDLVVEVKFTEWTDEASLRHPVYLGQRQDIDPKNVRREPRPERLAPTAKTLPNTPRGSTSQRGPQATSVKSVARPAPADRKRPNLRGAHAVRPRGLPRTPALDSVVEALSALEEAHRNGTLTIPEGINLEVTNLSKVLWPGPRITKGELLRYYVRVSPWLLPVVADRPLVMKRFPNGITAKTFYQQRAPREVPAGIRVEEVEEDGEVRPRLVGGSLPTLLYMTQLAAISQDPWFSRVQSPDSADYVALDLDPMPGVPFAQVRDVARAVGEELRNLNVPAFPKTSGASGLHIYIPLPPKTSFQTGQLFCQIVATLVAARHPTLATTERAVSRRGRTVYVDYLQNMQGKSLATAYGARASEFAGVSTPLQWAELDEEVHPEDFTLRTVIPRLEEVGDLWAGLRGDQRADLHTALEKLAARF